MPGYIQKILNAFSSMDIEKLHLHLKNEYSYEETTKEVFLREIEKIFRRFKNAGDTELIIYQGKCGGKNCPNCGKKGYRFVGIHSKNYLDLIFKTEGDNITDLGCCALFKTDEKIKKLKNQHKIDVNEDERVSFVKTPEYLAKLNAATTAWNEIITSPPRKMNFQDLIFSTYTGEEASIQYKMCDSKEETKKITSLSFHLQNRKELENKGIFVPLWINERQSDN